MKEVINIRANITLENEDAKNVKFLLDAGRMAGIEEQNMMTLLMVTGINWFMKDPQFLMLQSQMEISSDLGKLIKILLGKDSEDQNKE